MMEYTIPARPTTYKGVEMRSRLEATFAQTLDRWGIEWEYEPRCFADETGQYLPDFVTRGWRIPAMGEGNKYHAKAPGGTLRRPVYFEVKPTWPEDPEQFIGWLNDIERRLQIIRSSEPRCGLYVWWPPSCDNWGVFQPPGKDHFENCFIYWCPACERPMFARGFRHEYCARHPAARLELAR